MQERANNGNCVGGDAYDASDGTSLPSCSLLRLPLEVLGCEVYSRLHAIEIVRAAVTCKPIFASLPDALKSVQSLDFGVYDLEFENSSSRPKTKLRELRQIPFELPPGLKRLNVSGTAVALLPVLPKTLRVLVCSNHMERLPEALSPSLVGLDIGGSEDIEQLPKKLPVSLRWLVCNGACNLIGLPESLSETQLAELHCKDTNVRTDDWSLPALPSTLKILSVGMTPLFCLPPTLSELPLVFFSCFATYIEQLPALPPTLQYLDCSQNDTLQALPSLPSGLRRLWCYRCLVLRALPSLPETLVELDCSHTRIAHLQGLPPFLKYLSCVGTEVSGTSLPPLPSSLVHIDCGDTFIRALPSPLPPALKRLGIWRTRVRALPALPPVLETLDCSGATLLKKIPTLPDTVMNLNCRNARSLAELPSQLPAALHRLDCSGTKICGTPFATLPPALCWLDCSATRIHKLPPSLPLSLRHVAIADTPLSDRVSFIVPPSEIHRQRCESFRASCDVCDQFEKRDAFSKTGESYRFNDVRLEECSEWSTDEEDREV